MNDDNIARGKAIVAAGKHATPRGHHLGRSEAWGLDVYEGSPQAWKDALAREWDHPTPQRNRKGA